MLAVAGSITIAGFLMDGDAKEPDMLMRFTEFIGMMGIVFLMTLLSYTVFTFTYKNLRKA